MSSASSYDDQLPSCHMYEADLSIHKQTLPQPASLPRAERPVLLEPWPPFTREWNSGTSPLSSSFRHHQPPCLSQLCLRSQPGQAAKQVFPLHLHGRYREHKTTSLSLETLLASPALKILSCKCIQELHRWRKTRAVTMGPRGDMYFLTVSAENCIFL